MRFLVIGHFAFDVFHSQDGSEVETSGGILHAVRTMAMLAGKGDVVIPVFGVQRGERTPLISQLERLPGIDTSGIFEFEQPTNRVHYFLSKGGSRVACSKDISPPIPFDRIKRYLDVDGILVNMVSGSDIALETLDQIRMAVRSGGVPIHFDYHNLTLGINAMHERFRRPAPEWRRWAFMIDTLQLNEEEIAGLPVERMPEERTVGHLLTLSVKAVLVTRGHRGVTLYQNEHKHVLRSEIGAASGDGSAERIGSGDVFGAAFVYHYVRSSNVRVSAETANSIAGSHRQMHAEHYAGASGNSSEQP